MSNDDYNPFLKRNLPPPPSPAQQPQIGPVIGAEQVPPVLDRGPFRANFDPQTQAPEHDNFATSPETEEPWNGVGSPGSSLPFQYNVDSNDRFTKWFWSFASAAVATGLLVAVIYQAVILRLLDAPRQDFGWTLLIAGGIGAVYGAMHATWKMTKLCTAIHIDEEAIIFSYGKRTEKVDPLSVDALMTLSGIDLHGDGKGFSNLRSIVMLRGKIAEKIAFEPISNARIFTALREACLHAWAIPAEGTLLPPVEIAEHHADRAGIDSLRRLRQYYGAFVMRLTFSSVSLIVLLLGGGGLLISTMGIQRIRGGMVKFLIFSGGLVIAALSSLRRLPREFGILRKIKETEKSLAVALGLDFAQ